MDINQIMNADYPIPDPAWDYSEVWHHAQAAAAFLRSPETLRFGANFDGGHESS
ncbi:MAG: hypothetical protein KA716_27925 [Gloeotrichia echinulata DEX184]|jgi:hypothetical protein|nr:hypothetical protein [Gloeotrichia echinulata DEX184]